MRDTESSVLTQRTEVANISGSRLAHVPHLSCKLGLAAPPNWRRTGVDLKWAEGELRSLCRLSRWLNAGIRGATANIKTQRKTYPSGVIKEGEIRWAASVCERVCVAELQPPPTLLSNTQILKQCTFLVPAVKRPRMKKRVFFKKRWQLLWSHICSLYWIVLGTLACKYLLIPALSEAEQTFPSSVKRRTHQVREWGSTHKQHHKSIDKICIGFRQFWLSSPLLSSQFLHFAVDSFVVETWMPIKMEWFIYQASPVAHFDTEINNSTNTKLV